MRRAVGWSVTGQALLATGSLARLYWRVLDAVDYWANAVVKQRL